MGLSCRLDAVDGKLYTHKRLAQIIVNNVGDHTKTEPQRKIQPVICLLTKSVHRRTYAPTVLSIDVLVLLL